MVGDEFARTKSYAILCVSVCTYILDMKRKSNKLFVMWPACLSYFRFLLYIKKRKKKHSHFFLGLHMQCLPVHPHISDTTVSNCSSCLPLWLHAHRYMMLNMCWYFFTRTKNIRMCQTHTVNIFALSVSPELQRSTTALHQCSQISRNWLKRAFNNNISFFNGNNNISQNEKVAVMGNGLTAGIIMGQDSSTEYYNVRAILPSEWRGNIMFAGEAIK